MAPPPAAGAKVATGQTPREVIWTRNKATLYRYLPSAETRFPVPLLLVYALIDRPFIRDLIPGNSFVEYLVKQGFDVYLLDWGVPDEEDRALLFGDYVFGYLAEAVGQVLRTSRAEAGHPVRGLHRGPAQRHVRGPVPGHSSAEPDPVRHPHRLLPGEPGVVPLDHCPGRSPRMASGAVRERAPRIRREHPRLLTLITGHLGTLLGRGNRLSQDPSLATWIALDQWVSEGIPFAGEAFRQMTHDLIQHNKLVKGEFQLRGRAVDLKNITCSLLSIAGTQDIICRVPQAEAIMHLVSSQDKEFCVLEGGHIGMLAGAEARQGLWLKAHRWLDARSQ